MFTPTRCHFELYAGSESTVFDFLALSKQAKPLFEAFGFCFGLEIEFYNKVNGEYLDTDELDQSDSTIKSYRFQVTYDCTEMYEPKARMILNAADAFCKYHGFHWHEKQIETIADRAS